MNALEAFRLTAAEFKGETDETVQKWMELAEPLLNKKRFGSLYPQALALLAAHKMKLAGLGENPLEDVPLTGAGGVASYSEGGVSVSYSASQQTNVAQDAEYGLTAYGAQFLTLRRSCIVTIVSSAEGV